jgi:hypothetical protein
MGGDEKQAKPKKANTIRVCQRKKFQKKNSFYRAEQRKQKTAVRKHVYAVHDYFKHAGGRDIFLSGPVI